MKALVKALILRTLDKLGYALVKKTAPAVTGNSTALPTVAPSKPLPAADSAPYESFGLSRHAAVEPEFQRFYERFGARSPLPGTRVAAVYCAIRYLSRAGVAGDIVDCGIGLTDTVAIIAAALAELGDTDRRLIVFDVSGNPTHRAEAELTLWGEAGDLLSPPRAHRDAPAGDATRLPADLLSSGYPANKVSIVDGAHASRRLSRADVRLVSG